MYATGGDLSWYPANPHDLGSRLNRKSSGAKGWFCFGVFRCAWAGFPCFLYDLPSIRCKAFQVRTLLVVIPLSAIVKSTWTWLPAKSKEFRLGRLPWTLPRKVFVGRLSLLFCKSYPETVVRRRHRFQQIAFIYMYIIIQDQALDVSSSEFDSITVPRQSMPLPRGRRSDSDETCTRIFRRSLVTESRIASQWSVFFWIKIAVIYICRR